MQQTTFKFCWCYKTSGVLTHANIPSDVILTWFDVIVTWFDTEQMSIINENSLRESSCQFVSVSQHILLWGLPKLCLFIFLLGIFLILQNCFLNSLNHIHIWQVSLQLSCSDTCQIWMWYSIGNKCFEEILKNLKNGMEEIGLVTPTSA